MIFYGPGDPRGPERDPRGGAKGAQSAISTPLSEISTPAGSFFLNGLPRAFPFQYVRRVERPEGIPIPVCPTSGKVAHKLAR